MKFTLTPEQEELRDLVRRYLSDRAPLAVTRQFLAQDRDFDPAGWTSTARELGIAGVDVDEDLGGVGLTAVELVLAGIETGATLDGGPFLAGAGFAAGLLLAADGAPGSRAADLLGRLVDGAVITAAVPDHGGAWRPADVTCAAVADPGRGWLLTGAKEAVLQVDQAELIVVAARLPGTGGRPGACGLFVVRPDDVRIRPLESIDPTRRLCRLECDASSAELLIQQGDRVIEDAYLRACVVLAAECLGGARSCLEMASSYARTRVQFGHTIGRFQAVKHRLADALVRVELATSAVYLAACHLATKDSAIGGSAPMALFSASEAFTLAAADAVQIHGGIAFTFEHDIHLFVKRARANRQLLGRPADQLDAVYASVARAG